MRTRRHEEYIFNCAALRLSNADAADEQAMANNARAREAELRGKRRLTADKTK
jgi:hypothetical protein